MGTATYLVELHDDGGTDNGGKDSFTYATKLTITVGEVYDPPVITLSTQSVVVNVDSSCVTAVGHVDISSIAAPTCIPNPPSYNRASMSSCVTGASLPPNVNIFPAFITISSIDTGATAVQFSITPFNTTEMNRIFASTPKVLAPCGALFFEVKTAQSGIVSFNVTLADSNGQVSVRSRFAIIVTGVNRAPSFDILPMINTTEDLPFSQANVATSISTGDTGQQRLTFVLTFPAESLVLFSKIPVLSAANGELKFTPAPGRFGNVLVNVTLKDDAGTQRAGSDTSVTKQILINIRPVNNQPTFTLLPVGKRDVYVPQGSGMYIVQAFATGLTAGHPNEDTCTAGSGICKPQQLTFIIEDISSPELFAILPVVSAKGTLNFTLSSWATGTAVIRMYLQDDGGTADGGVDKSPVQIFTIFVTKKNIPPSVFLPWDVDCLTQATIRSCVCPMYSSPALSEASPVCKLSE